MTNPHKGSSLDDLLKEDGTLNDVNDKAMHAAMTQIPDAAVQAALDKCEKVDWVQGLFGTGLSGREIIESALTAAIPHLANYGAKSVDLAVVRRQAFDKSEYVMGSVVLALDALLAARKKFTSIDPDWNQWHIFPKAIEALNAVPNAIRALSPASEADLRAENERLREAARKVVERWDTPNWKDTEPTENVINDLRYALNPSEKP